MGSRGRSDGVLRLCCHRHVVVERAAGLERWTTTLRCITVGYGLSPVVGQPSERLESGTVVASEPPPSMTKTPMTVLPSLS